PPARSAPFLGGHASKRPLVPFVRAAIVRRARSPGRCADETVRPEGRGQQGGRRMRWHRHFGLSLMGPGLLLVGCATSRPAWTAVTPNLPDLLGAAEGPAHVRGQKAEAPAEKGRGGPLDIGPDAPH